MLLADVIHNEPDKDAWRRNQENHLGEKGSESIGDYSTDDTIV
jgi:hypothetical protein